MTLFVFCLVVNIKLSVYLSKLSKWLIPDHTVPNRHNYSVQCRFRRMVSQMEPEVHEVPRLFRTVLHDCVDEATGNDELQPHEVVEKQQRSKSLSFITFRSKFRSGQFFKGSNLSGSRGNLQEHLDWSDEEGDDGEREEKVIQARARKGRSRSMPDISPMEQSSQR